MSKKKNKKNKSKKFFDDNVLKQRELEDKTDVEESALALAAETAEAEDPETEKNETQSCEESRVPGIIFTCINAFLLLAVTVSAVIIHKNVFTLDLYLNGEDQIVLNYGDVYAEDGAQASFYGTLLVKEAQNAEVKTQGTVDTSVIGEYKVFYEATYVLDYFVGEKTYTSTVERTVSVVDTLSPVIELVHDAEAYTVPGDVYAEEGFTAFDGYDGDLTDKVVKEERDGKVYYSVSDLSGNVATAEREINYYDPYPPEIFLLGDTDVTLTVGDNYSEAGYTATDNVDGDLSDLVAVEGSVDTETPGTYTVVYTVTDSYNNSCVAVRTVSVKRYIPPVSLPQGTYGVPENPNGKVIYLTFDDGPSKHTSRLLDILDKYGVKATFFVINTEYFDIVPRMVSSGHTVAMHAYEHNYNKVYESEDAYFSDLYAIQSKINEYTGETPTILRFPGGSSNRVSRFNPGIMTRLAEDVKDMGYRYFDWTVDSCDAGGTRTAWGVYNNVISYVPKFQYSVVLQHDIYGYSVDAVEKIIVWGLENGYTFLPLTNQSPVCEHNIKN